MLFSDATFIGIDPTAGDKPFIYAALDFDSRLLALGQGTIDDVLAFCAGQRHAAVAVCGPRQPNQGVMANPEARQRLSPSPHPGRWENFRLAEYLLRQRNISIPQTPADEDSCPRWMQMAFRLHRRLADLGYQAYPHPSAERQSMEIYPFASYAVLLEILPLPKNSLEGRLQRQLILYQQEIDLPDPMGIFEEITRFRLLKGILPLEKVYSPGELDALVAAYTALLAVTQPGKVTLLGDPGEGQVVLPAAELKAQYS